MNFLSSNDRAGSNHVPSIQDLSVARTNTFFSGDYDDDLCNNDATEQSDEPNEVHGISLDKYKPMEEITHYGQYFISPNTGTYNLTPPLPQHIADYIREFHSDADLSLWDGTLGTYGRNYLSHRPSSSSDSNELCRMMTIEDLETLRGKYMQLIVDITPRAVLDNLRKNLVKQTGIQSKLEESIQKVEGKIEKISKSKERLEMNIQDVNSKNSDKMDKINDMLNLMDDKLIYSNDELNTLLKVNKQLKQKILQIDFEINERETGHLRKIALLRKIFGEEPLIGGLILKFMDGDKNPECLADEIYHYDMLSMKCSRLLFQTKCFYLDCLQAKNQIYKLENSLKSILENLTLIMDSLSSSKFEHFHKPWGSKNAAESDKLKKQTSSNSVFHRMNSTKDDPNSSNGNVFGKKASFFFRHLSSNRDENTHPNEMQSMSMDADDELSYIDHDIQATSGGATGNRMSGSERDFRFRYVKKVWNTIDTEFRLIHQYIEHTTLPLAHGRYHDKEGQKLTRLGSSPSGGSPGKDYGIFGGGFSHNDGGSGGGKGSVNVLPRFTTVELTHALNKRAKVACLHRHAARVYKQVNVIYDVHNEVVDATLELLQKRTLQDRQANENLIRKWEDLLGVSND